MEDELEPRGEGECSEAIGFVSVSDEGDGPYANIGVVPGQEYNLAMALREVADALDDGFGDAPQTAVTIN